MTNEIFDYLIVGSGPAGSVLARRLVEEPGAKVCVLEAGGMDRNPYLHIPAGYTKTLYGDRYTWPFRTEAGADTDGRSIALPQGRVVGGTSSNNGMVYSRGQPEDFDTWEAMGNPGWSYRDLLPYFRRSERRIGVADERFRGRQGELPITDSDWKDVLCEAFIRGAAEQGIPRNDDYNGQMHDGAGYFQRYIHRGWRISAATAFLRPAVAKGVDLKTHAWVTRILIEDRRAVGVEYRDRAGVLRTIRARRGVLVCAGTLNSPKVLQLSGIGPAAHLQATGLQVLHDLPGVGHNLQDHYTVRLSARVRSVLTLNEQARGWRLALEVMKWVAGRPSILALSPSLVHVFWKSDPALTRGDIQVLFTPGSYKPGKVYVLDDHPGMTCGARQQRPESRGSVLVRSPDPFETPLVQPNYLAEATDREVVVRAVRVARRIMRSQALAPYFEAETVPGANVTTDDEILDFARRSGNTGYHLVGTCRMGPKGDVNAVVGPDLKVHGIDGLHVVDASVMPNVPSANTLAATLMIAEKAAALLVGRPLAAHRAS